MSQRERKLEKLRALADDRRARVLAAWVPFDRLLRLGPYVNSDMEALIDDAVSLEPDALLRLREVLGYEWIGDFDQWPIPKQIQKMYDDLRRDVHASCDLAVIIGAEVATIRLQLKFLLVERKRLVAVHRRRLLHREQQLARIELRIAVLLEIERCLLQLLAQRTYDRARRAEDLILIQFKSACWHDSRIKFGKLRATVGKQRCQFPDCVNMKRNHTYNQCGHWPPGLELPSSPKDGE